MSFFEANILIVFLAFIWFALWRGLLQTIGSILGIFLGVILASRWYETVLGFFSDNLSGNKTASIIAFVILFIVIVKLFGIVLSMFLKMFNIITLIPGLKILDRLAGAALGAVEGALVLGVILNFITHLPIATGFEGTIESSSLSNFFMTFASWLVPLFPEALRKATDMINSV